VFVFDTSALLALYRLSKETHASIEKVLDKVKERLWIPNHVQFEFMKNREGTLYDALQMYGSFLNKSFKGLHSQLQHMEHELKDLAPDNLHKNNQISFSTDQYAEIKKHFDELLSSKNAFRNTCKKHAESRKHELNEMFKNDVVLEIIKQYFMVGEPYSFNKIIDITKEGVHRYQCSIPPGFKDDHKDGTQKFGDLIIWKQLIGYAVESKQNIVFVTNDVLKGDWGVVSNKCFTSPQLDLISEFYDTTGKTFWIYTLPSFLSKAVSLLNVAIPEEQLMQVNQTLEEPDSAFKINYRCSKCRRVSMDVIDANDLEFETIDSFERGMGIERQYEATTVIMCPNCQSIIHVDIVGWEYPEGSPLAIDVDIEGAKLLWSSDYIQRTEDQWDEICEDRYSDMLISEMKDG
ncbi:MAG: PIN domain-containing protein, partial [Candidatus Cloacimonetes bacterium]|nr:PIN domain-containing protein [Candidatus Cloacimonadota bacterium]